MFSTKRMQYDVPTTLLSLLYIFAGSFIALSILTFHKNSIVYKKREKLAKQSVAIKDKQAPSHKSGDGDSDGMDLHGSLDALRTELYDLVMDFVNFLSVRLVIGAILVGSGVVLMHFTGQQAMRCDDVSAFVSPVMAAIAFPLAWIGSVVILFFLYHMHGFKRRLIAALILGPAVNLVHYYGFFSTTFVLVEPRPEAGSGLAVDAEMACVVVSILSSVARFVFMGMIAATTD